MTKHRSPNRPSLLPVVVLVWSLAGCAQGGAETLAEASALSQREGDDAPPPCHRRRPPPEAIEACTGKAAGDACTVSLPDREIEGTCTAPPPDAPDDAALFCLPADAPPPPPREGGRRGDHPPPPEAFTACEGVAVGDACTVEHDGETLDGTCLTPPWDEDAAAACVPAGRAGG